MMTKHPDHSLPESSEAALETLNRLGNSTLDSAEKLAALNIETARSGFNRQMERIAALMQAKTFQEFLALQNTLTKPGLQNTINYCSKAYAIANESQQELQRLAESGYSEFAKSVNSILDRAAKTTPASGPGIAAAKSALDSAQSTYRRFNDSSRKAAEIAEASFKVSADATSKAIDALSQPGKKNKA